MYGVFIFDYSILAMDILDLVVNRIHTPCPSLENNSPMAPRGPMEDPHWLGGES